MSTHAVNVIEIQEVQDHPNADKLDIIPVGGWQVVVGKGQFRPGDKAVYIEPDYMVPTERPEFSFLGKGKGQYRLKAKRLRGELSFGLLIPVPEDLNGVSVGDDVMGQLGIERYIPRIKTQNNGVSDDLPGELWPNTYSPKFDVESLRNYPHIIHPEEKVIVTEKIHGANARYLYQDGNFYIGSRTRWKNPEIKSVWSIAADNDPRIQEWCKRHPGVTLYGEVYGPVQSLRYGMISPAFAAFAAFAKRSDSVNPHWIDTEYLHNDLTLPTVPILYQGPYDFDIIKTLAEEDSSVGTAPKGHMREGVVVVPVSERADREVGRVIFKHISNRYWES